MLKSILLALSILVVTPLAVQASEITLIPAVKLQIGDQDRGGNYWDGGHWRDRGWWNDHYDKGHHDKDHHDNGNHNGHYKHH